MAMWRRVFHLIAKVGAGSPAPGRFGSIRLWTKTGAGASRNPYMLKCAVFSGDGIALLLTPGTGVCKPVMVDGAVLTDGDEVDEAPKPISQHPSFTLRYGNVRMHDCASGDTVAGQQHRFPARTFDVIGLTGRERQKPPFLWPLSRR